LRGISIFCSNLLIRQLVETSLTGATLPRMGKYPISLFKVLGNA
jgi:hypothetical protein